MLLFITTLLGIFLRFFRLEQFANFLADQGRDAIIIKRIATLEHLTAIGPPTSIGHVFLGPFYYYFIAPWLLIFNFNPVGLVFGVAFFSTAYLIINYFIAKDFFDKKTALLSTIFLTFSTTLIEFSRFSWNPNLLPLFSLLTFFFLVKGVGKKSFVLMAAFGAFLSFSIQLHYLALFLIPPSVVYLSVKFFQQKKQIIFNLSASALSLISFIICSSPLIIFDLKHQFINSKSFIALFKTPGQIATNKIDNLLISFNYLNKYVFNIELPIIITSLLLLLLLGLFIYNLKTAHIKLNALTLFFLFFFLGLVGVSIYPGPKHAHYFGIVFPFYFIIIAVFISKIPFKKMGMVILCILVGAYVYSNSKGYRFLYADQLNQIAHAQKVAAFLDKKIGNSKFNFAVQPDSWQEGSYLYFLELMGKRPADRERQEVTDQMFVVCGDPCNLYKTPSWNVNMFGKFKIVNQWPVEGVKIYKLIHVKAG